MTKSDFEKLLAPLMECLRDRPLDASLERHLNEVFPVGSPFYQSILKACRLGAAAGWICEREAAGIRYGRVIKPNPATNDFSVDVVQMRHFAGPHHMHPNGEIDLIIPTEDNATMDNHPAGWLVYGPGSEHTPTVAGGCAYIMYLLPGGAIEFTRA